MAGIGYYNAMLTRLRLCCTDWPHLIWITTDLLSQKVITSTNLQYLQFINFVTFFLLWWPRKALCRPVQGFLHYYYNHRLCTLQPSWKFQSVPNSPAPKISRASSCLLQHLVKESKFSETENYSQTNLNCPQTFDIHSIVTFIFHNH